MRRIIVTGLLLCVLEQARGDDPPQSCMIEAFQIINNYIAQADACTSYTGNNQTECENAISDPSDPENCITVNVGFDSNVRDNRCKKFTSVASQLCTLFGMETRRNVTVEAIPLNPETGERYDITDVFFKPEAFSSETCRNFFRMSLTPAFQSLSNETVENMCTAKVESSDDSETDLAIGLGVGLGVGLPLVGGIIYVLVRRSKAPKTTESLEPFLS